MMLPNRTVRTLSRRSLHTIALLAAFTVSSLMLGGPAVAQEETPPITVEAVTVEPASPGPDTLCKLTVKLANAGDRTASQLDFKVKINGQELPVYSNQLFMFPVPAGETVDIPLYNFWSTETSRPAPADGKLDIEVTLAAAQWTEIKVEADVEVWRPLGPVEGLPIARTLALSMSK
ncbi:MAG: hypothetical protein WBQ30_06890 [Thermoanaerobaculia bacterium]